MPACKWWSSRLAKMVMEIGRGLAAAHPAPCGPARGEITRFIVSTASATMLIGETRRAGRSPPLRGRYPAGQRGELSRQHLHDAVGLIVFGNASCGMAHLHAGPSSRKALYVAPLWPAGHLPRKGEIRLIANAAGLADRSSEAAYPNFPVLGNPFGTIRPAEARAPAHSRSSARLRVKTRSAESCHERPLSMAKILMSSRPPSLYF